MANAAASRLESAIAEVEHHAGDGGANASLAAAVAELAAELQSSMMELRSIGAGRIGAEDIPTASDELDAIVEVTASATGAILDACELVEDAAANLSGDALTDALIDATSSIYQACSFQDLTGQRVTKVVTTLRRIDARVSAICALFGLEATDLAAGTESEPADPNDEARLLNGPALPDQAMSQDDIDKILGDSD